MGNNPNASNTEIFLLALTIYREASNQSPAAKLGVAWSIRNRVDHPAWYGHDYFSVITKPAQYTSMVPPAWDPNLKRYPNPQEQAWIDSFQAAGMAYTGTVADPTEGAQYYFDKSMDGNPPKWAAAYAHTVDIGDIHFYKG